MEPKNNINVKDNTERKKKSSFRSKNVKLEFNVDNNLKIEKPSLKKQVSINENDLEKIEQKKKKSFKEKRNVYEKRDSRLIKDLMNNPNMINDILEKNLLEETKE